MQQTDCEGLFQFDTRIYNYIMYIVYIHVLYMVINIYIL